MRKRVRHFRCKTIPLGYEPVDGHFVVDVVTDDLSTLESLGGGKTRAKAYRKAIERYPQADAILLGNPHDISQNMEIGPTSGYRLLPLRTLRRFAYAAVPLRKSG